MNMMLPTKKRPKNNKKDKEGAQVTCTPFIIIYFEATKKPKKGEEEGAQVVCHDLPLLSLSTMKQASSKLLLCPFLQQTK
jgi:hypothetical protein